MTVAAAGPAAESQHMAALQLANRYRLAKAADKRDLKAGRLKVSEVLGRPHWANATVMDVLLTLQRFGRTRALKLLRDLPPKTEGGVLVVAGVTEHKRLADLTDRQRGLLADALG